MSLSAEYSLWWIPFCLLLGVGYATLLYWRTSRPSMSSNTRVMLALCRTLSVALIAFLLLNPLFNKSKKELEKVALEMVNIPFETENNLLFKFFLFKFPNKTGGVIINIHHLISDSWTLGLISKERYDKLNAKIEEVNAEIKRVSTLNMSPSKQLNDFLEEITSEFAIL